MSALRRGKTPTEHSYNYLDPTFPFVAVSSPTPHVHQVPTNSNMHVEPTRLPEVTNILQTQRSIIIVEILPFLQIKPL